MHDQPLGRCNLPPQQGQRPVKLSAQLPARLPVRLFAILLELRPLQLKMISTYYGLPFTIKIGLVQ